MTIEHQPGSPGAVDLDALERRLELDLGSWGNSKKYAAVFAELRTLRARVESYAMALAALEGTNAANEGALRIQLERLHGERFRAEAAEARVKELEEKNAREFRLFDGAMALAKADVERGLVRITDLESQLAAAREEQGLEARVAETLGARFMALSLVRLFSGTWRAEWEGELSDVRRPRPVMRAHAADLPALLRAILECEAKGGPSPCQKPPDGWLCTRDAGHDGPCAARPEKGTSSEG